MEERSVWKWAKVRYWLETEKSDEHVLKALKLNGKNEAAMKLEHNYKYYEYFAKKSLDYRLNGWLRSKTTTWDAWKKLLLQNKVTERGQLKDIADTSEFSIYVRYVNEYDNYMHTTLINSYSIPHLPIPRGASDAELYARVKIMAIAQREDAFAKVMLGLTDTVKRRRVTLKGNALMQHEDYKWYQLFGELKAAEAAATHT
ncbi:RxLR effector protein [Phytophthora megakarya]|uniref:RxLR effector protein n=1 Tax=Phytophthora megakarya TaxID=4795 RepID=A0A225WU66_9STRA|nr:RxLR effector protein [Phytophthora megakarya]